MDWTKANRVSSLPIVFCPLTVNIKIDSYIGRMKNRETDRIHGYLCLVRVGRGHICAGAVIAWESETLESVFHSGVNV